jgi:hypothetical protein
MLLAFGFSCSTHAASPVSRAKSVCMHELNSIQRMTDQSCLQDPKEIGGGGGSYG